jgi:hypothetical protein
MAEYGARESEFRKIYEEQFAADRKRFESDGSALASAESAYSEFERSYKDYMDWRDRKLNDSLSILKNTSSAADSIQNEWRSYFESAASEGSDRISRECRDDKAPGLRSLADSLANSESTFFRKIGSFNFAPFCGFARWALKSFREKRDELGTEWTTIKSNDNSTDEKARVAAEQIRSLYEDTINDLVNKKANIQSMKQKAEDWARDLVKSTADVPEGIDTALPSQVWQMAEYYLTLMGQLRSKNSDLVKKLEEAFEQEDRTVIKFVETRNRTRSFVSNTNLGLVEKEFNNRRDSCARFADEVPTS